MYAYSSVIAQGISCISPHVHLCIKCVCGWGGGGDMFLYLPVHMYGVLYYIVFWSFVCVCKFLHLKFISVCVILCVMISVLDLCRKFSCTLAAFVSFFVCSKFCT